MADLLAQGTSDNALANPTFMPDSVEQFSHSKPLFQRGAPSAHA